jgi:hypothetical protein
MLHRIVSKPLLLSSLPWGCDPSFQVWICCVCWCWWQWTVHVIDGTFDYLSMMQYILECTLWLFMIIRQTLFVFGNCFFVLQWKMTSVLLLFLLPSLLSLLLLLKLFIISPSLAHDGMVFVCLSVPSIWCQHLITYGWALTRFAWWRQDLHATELLRAHIGEWTMTRMLDYW